jgi:hypothetical protein
VRDIFGKRVFFTLYDDAYDNRILPRNRLDDVEWGDFVELLYTEQSVVTRKDKAKLLSPVRFLKPDDPRCKHARYTDNEERKGLGRSGALKRDEEGKPYTWRGAQNVEQWSMLPIDIDGQQPIAQAKEYFREYTYVAYTSFRHLLDGKTEKFRLLIPLEVPIDHKTFTARLPAIKTWVGDIDLSSLAASRGFYVPAVHPDRKHFFSKWHNEGDRFLDLLEFTPQKARAPKNPSTRTTLNLADIRNSLTDDDRKAVLLQKLHDTYVGKYETWWKVSSAMLNAGFTLEDFNYVTIGGMMKEKTAEDCEKQWRKAIGRHQRGNSIHPGFLYNLVGWSSELRLQRKTKLAKEIEELEQQLLEGKK